MTFTYDVAALTTSLAKVRLLCRDTDSTNQLFQDEELEFFIAENTVGGTVYIYHAAALALEVLAGSDARVGKVKIGNYSKEQTIEYLHKVAAQYRTIEATAEDAELAVSDFALRDIIHNKALREL